MDDGQTGATLRTDAPAAAAPTPDGAPSPVPEADDSLRLDAAQKAVQKAAKAARKAAKAARKAAKAERKAAKAERKAAEKAARKAAKAERRAAEVASSPDGRDAPPGSWVRVPVEGAANVSAMASGVLDEVADLVRQAAAPAARIVERVDRPPQEPPPSTAEPTVEPGPMEPASPSTGEPSAVAFAPDAGAPNAVEPPPATAAEEPAASAGSVAPASEPVLEPPTGEEPAQQAGVPADLEGGHAASITIAPGAVIGAAIDIGANSVHLLVAAAGGHRVEPLLDESVFLGLGDRVAERGMIGADLRAQLVGALADYTATARRLGAQTLTIVGTEPVRRAVDSASLVEAAERTAGVALHVLDHDEEAMLTLLGVTMGRPVRSELLVVDIGGGSCELVHAAPDGGIHAVGLPLGSARLTLDLVRGDPPTLPEIEALRAAARAGIVGAPEVKPAELIAVGGTASNLLRLMPSTSLDRMLTRRRIAVALAMLSVQRSDEAAERHLLRPQRARILPAGAIIADAVLERYGLDRLRVVDEGIREGAVLAAAAAGAGWRDRLPALVRGWQDEGPRPE